MGCVSWIYSCDSISHVWPLLRGVMDTTVEVRLGALLRTQIAICYGDSGLTSNASTYPRLYT